MRSIYYGFDHILSATDYNQPNMHKHWAKHIVVSLENKISVTIGINNIECGGVIINSNILHTVSCDFQRHLVFSFEEASNVSGNIESNYLRKSDFCLLCPVVVDAIRREFTLFNLSDATADYYNMYHKILVLLGLQLNQCMITDKRIMKALELIKGKKGINNDIIKEILEVIDISQSRFSHLFKEQVGLPLSSYLVMIKLKKAYQYIFEGCNVTNAALIAGFDSSSHFAATSKDMIGLSAKNISQDCRFIEV